MKNLILKIIVMLLFISFIFISCTGVDETENISTRMNIAMREELCTEIANNWVGVFIRYKGPDDFLSKCNLIHYNTEMELAQKVRPLIPDGHFYIGLADFHDDNNFSEAKIIPLTMTYDIYDNAVIAKSPPHLQEKGLKEGNIILKINNIEILYYIDNLMKLLPQSSYYESKEKAYRLLFTSVLKPMENFYFELPFLDVTKPIKIDYIDTSNGKIDTVELEFESLFEYLPNGILDVSLNDYWSMQRYYDVPEDNYCTSENEFATLKEVNGKKWLIYHPLSFYFDVRDNEKILQSLQCYSKFVNDADYFILDLRDSVGGSNIQRNIIMGIIGVTKSTTYHYELYRDGEFDDYGDAETLAIRIEGLEFVKEGIPVYIWTNAIAGSSCDLFLHAVRNSGDSHIKMIGKPSAGRMQSVIDTGVLDFAVSMPLGGIFDENGIRLEGKFVMPDYYFDVEAKDYKTPDNVFLKYVEFIKKNNL